MKQQSFTFAAVCVVLSLSRPQLNSIVFRRLLVGRVLNTQGDHVFSRDELLEFCTVYGLSVRQVK